MAGFLIAAAHKSSGKTTISIGLAAALRVRGDKVQTFKKGPDYIDPMWLKAASGQSCYNLDFNIMNPTQITQLYAQKSFGADICLVEANKGLYDGVAVDGSDSNAQLAKLLNLPVILVIDTIGMTRGVAPLLLGYQAFDKDINIAGIILNKVGGVRHEGKLRAAIKQYSDIKILGSIRKNIALDISERHLGLATPCENKDLSQKITAFTQIIKDNLDLDEIVKIAKSAPFIKPKKQQKIEQNGVGLRIGIIKDKAFGFYYPDDLEAFEQAGAELVFIDSLQTASLPKIDGLFIGGGFPEIHMQAISKNESLRNDIKSAIMAGLPTYAECGGLMYLCSSINWQEKELPMVGVIKAKAIMNRLPQGRGYTKYKTLASHPWGNFESKISAHEFHYASLERLSHETKYAQNILRGYGIDGENDGIVIKNLLAGFCHLRNSKNYPWVTHFLDFVKRKTA